MKSLRAIFVLLAVLCLGAGSAWAQPFFISFTNESPMMTTCGGSTPIPDGTPVDIVWDLDPAGPSANDVLPALCQAAPNCDEGSGPSGTVNFNTFVFNADFWGNPEGVFLTDYFTCFQAPPSPSRYYLRICLPNANYVSNSMTFAAGSTQDRVVLNTEWTCTPAPCAGVCTAPVLPTAVTATDSTLCTGVQLNWTYPDTATNGGTVDKFVILRGGVGIDTINSNFRTYLDITAATPVRYEYGIKARRNCGGGQTAYTTAVNDFGSRYPSPALPTNVTASDNVCDSVIVQWNIGSAAGLDSFIVKRANSRVGAIPVGGPGLKRFAHATTSPDSAQYRVVCWNHVCLEIPDDSVDYGRALQDPDTVNGTGATTTLCDSVVITWIDNTDETGYIVHRIPQGGSTEVTFTVAANLTRYKDVPPLADTNYEYWVIATNACGSSVAPPHVIGSKSASPGTVSGVGATDSTLCDRVTVTWTNIANETGYRVFRTPVAGGATDSFAVGVDVVQYHDMSALAGTQYNYSVRAFNGCGPGGMSTANVGARKRAPLAVPTVTAQDTGTCTQVQVSWTTTANTDSFYVFRNGTQIARVPLATLTYLDTPPLTGVKYGYAVQPKNTCGLGTLSAADSGATRTAPGAVTGLVASDTLCSGVVLTWNNVAGEDSFRIFRAGVQIANVGPNVLTYTDTPAAGTYAYTVDSKNTCGLGTVSNSDNGTKLPNLPAVTNISASSNNCNAVVLGWTTVAGADSFQIWRNGTRIGSTTPPTISYSDLTGTADTTYAYTVVAFNRCGAGAVAATVNGVKPGPVTATGLQATLNSCSVVQLTWTNPTGEDSIVIKRDGARLAKVLANVTSYDDASAVPGTPYTYTITAYNLCGAGPESDAVNGSRIVLPTVPAGLTASEDNCNHVALSWTASTGAVVSYTIYRNADSLTTLTETTYNDASATPGVTYAYTVKANSAACGSSLASASDNGTRLVTPSVPTNLQATTTRCDSVVITFTASTGDVDGYILYEGTGFLTGFEPTATLRYAYVPEVGSKSYFVRAFSNECGPTELTSAVTGTRLEAPTSATGLSATINRCDGVNLTWTAGTGSIAHYIVKRDGNEITTTTGTSYSDPVGDTNPHTYTVTSHSATCGDAAATADATGQRLPAPTAPSNVAADTNRCDSVYVTWTASTGTFTQYIILRDGVARDSVPVGFTRWGEAPLPGEQHRYTVAASDPVCGRSDTLTGALGRRQEDAFPPANIEALGTCEAIEVAWNTSAGGVDHYKLYRDGTLLTTVSAPDTTYIDVTERGESHTYKVSAVSLACGETNFSPEATALRLPLLAAVSGVSASDDDCDGILVEWTALVGAARYRIYRDGTLIDSVLAADQADGYFDDGIEPAATPSYTVAAVNICGPGEQSEAAQGFRYHLATATTEIAASDSSCTAIYVEWLETAMTDSYRVVRDDTVSFVVVHPATSFTDTPTAGSHTYKVYSLNRCGASTASEMATGLRIPGVAPIVGGSTTQNLCDRIEYTWFDATNEDGYYVYRDDVLIDTLDANVTSYTDTVAAPGSYNYSVSGFNVCGLSDVIEHNTGTRRTVPPRVTESAATQDSCSSVTLTWTDVSTELGYLIFRDGVRIDSVDANTTTYVDDELEPGTYSYTIQGFNACGHSGLSDITPGRVPDVPGVIADLAASTVHCDNITLTWTTLPEATGYRILRDDTLLVSTSGATATWIDETVLPGPHNYTIIAYNYCGEGDTSVISVGERQTIPMGEPVLTAPDSACQGTVTITWTEVPDVTGYVVYRDLIALDTVDATPQSFTDVLVPTGTHRYKVQAINECGAGPLPVLFEEVLFVPLPAVPGNVIASTTHCLDITIDWDSTANATGYKVLRGVDTVATLEGTAIRTYVDTGATVGQHAYRVIGFNACGLGPNSEVAQGTRRGVPAAVTNVTATDTLCDRVDLAWLPSSDVLGYVIYRDGVAIDTVDAATLTFTDTPEIGTYPYTIWAYNDCGNAAAGGSDMGTRMTVPVQVTGVAAGNNSCDGILVNWDATSGARSYIIYRNGIALDTVDAPVTSFMHFQAPLGNGLYTVRAYNACGDGLLSLEDEGTRLEPPQIAITPLASENLCGSIHIQWSGNGGDVDSFIVIRDGVRIAMLPAGTLFYDDAISGSHGYSVIAFSHECGAADTSAVDSGYGYTAPGVPILTFNGPAICDTVRFTWTVPTGDVTGYIITRNGVPIDTVTETHFGDVTVDDDSSYAYRVIAFNPYCANSNPSLPVGGNLRHLISFANELPDTVYSMQWVRMEFNLCPNIDSMVYYYSENGGAYVYLQTRPPAPVDSIQAPDSLDGIYRIRIEAYRDGRMDTLLTPPVRLIWLGVDEEPAGLIPTEFFVDQNYPNPFNPTTVIRFGLPQSASVKVVIYDVLGREVANLADKVMQPGVHKLYWDCSGCPSGMYLVRVTAGEQVMLRKMLLMK